MQFADSIVALSSGRLPAGVAVIRLSGPHCRFVAERVLGLVPEPRVATYTTLRDGAGAVIDRGIALFFPGPASFTGEDVVEFQTHGGKAVVTALLERLVEVPGVRHALPGEFTRRAFLNGRLDLLETEALADLVSAETEAQRRQAVRNAMGVQSDLYLNWRRQLIHARAMLEASIDFADEGDVADNSTGSVLVSLGELAGTIRQHAEGFKIAEIVRDGFQVVIVGPPNAGKSTLFNALARRDVAIVSDEAGTTRDILEVTLDLCGLKVVLTDTAGLRDGVGKVESIGIARARERARDADLVLLVEDMSRDGPAVNVWDGPAVRVGTKADLVHDSAASPEVSKGVDLMVSAVTGSGMEALIESIGSHARKQVGDLSEVLPSRLRHVELLRRTERLLGNALSESEPELQAEMLRLASDELGRLTGAIDVEDLLDVIFAQFCIGK